MKIEGQRFGGENEGKKFGENGNWERRILNLGRAPAFFIPFSPTDEEGLSNLLKQNLRLYNGLLNQGIPAFWRSFGINGYVLNEEQYLYLLNIGINSIIGLPYDFHGSFVIISEFNEHPGVQICDLGSSAIVAAYKGLSLLKEGYIKSNVFRISRNGGGAICDYKGIPLEILPKDYLRGYFNDQSFLDWRELELQPIPPNLELITMGTMGSPFILKIDVNNSTKKKLENENWLEVEWRNVSFSTIFLNELIYSQSDVILVDLIGESVVIICPSSSLVAEVYKSLKKTMSLFPDIKFTAVGRRLSEVTIFQSENGFPIYYYPYIEEQGKNGFYLLETKYKKGRPRRSGTFLIS